MCVRDDDREMEMMERARGGRGRERKEVTEKERRPRWPI